MLTLWGDKDRYCDGFSRRNFLQIGALGAGLTLADMLQLRAQAGENTTTGKAKSVILIYLGGGPSHMDMYDLKPDAPKEFRGDFKPIQTNVPGVQICEHFPMQAKMWDKLACVRSLTSVNEHSDSLVMTGYSNRANQNVGHPSMGAVISKLRSASAQVPPFVSLRGMSRGSEPGYLGVAHRAFTPNGPGRKNLVLTRGVDAARLQDRKSLLEGFDNVRREIDTTGTMEGMDAFSSRAIDIVTSGAVSDALDRNKEDAKVRARYKGIENFLLARRLVEVGVGFVTLSYGGWDTHNQNFPKLKKQLPNVDRGIANLVQDLHDRGLGDDVITVMWGEFGRTPKINKRAGRDHWPSAMGAFIAGGGLKMGQAVGSTNARGERPKDSPYTVQNVHSTIYRALGIDPSMTFENGSGRPIHLLDDLAPVAELI